MDNKIVKTLKDKTRVEPEYKLKDAKTGVGSIDSMTLTELYARPDLGMMPQTAEPYRQRLKVLSYLNAVEKTAARLERNAIIRQAKINKRHEMRGKIVAESKLIGEMTQDGDNHDDHENVVDYGGETPTVSKLGVSLRDTPDGQKTQYSLSKFFERPVPIYDDDWTLGTEHLAILKVWDLWSLNQAVRAKLSNYAYFKGTMKVKISFSGTPFHYGVVMASYQPYPTRNTNLTKYNSFLAAATLPTAADTNAALKMYLSQAPGCDYISVTDNEPLVLEIPFISYKEKFRLWNSSNLVITASTSFDDFEEAGSLYLQTVNPIQVANEDYSSPVSFNVYAWVEDIELGCISGTEIDITAESKLIRTEAKRKGGNATVGKKAKQIEDIAEDIQSESYSQRAKAHNAKNMEAFHESKKDKPMYSGKGNVGERFMDSIEAGVRGDEFSTPGPVENVASAVTKIGNTLSDMPVIGAFAKATSTVASGIGKVASLFGWSRPLVLEKPIFVKNNPFANGAFTEGPETTLKLTCDPKQELTVDPSIGGMWSEDEMTILSIASRESYLTTFSWQDTDVAMTTSLWESIVTPFQHAKIPMGSLQLAFQPTAMEAAALPFNYWRGTIKYRFEIVCSKFHRGKLVFIYEPNDAQKALITSSTIQLNQHNTVILDIQESQDITIEVDWAAPRSWGRKMFEAANPNSIMENTTSIGSIDSRQNGFLVVRALNELVQPTDLADVKINVYVSCDDLQVAVPDYNDIPNNRVIATESKQVINPTGAKNDDIHLMHFGEKWLSFRSLLKRYQTWYPFYTSSASTGPHVINSIVATYPQVMSDSTSVYADSLQPTLFEYLRYSYMGMRGGGRYRVVPNLDMSQTTNYVRTTLHPQYPIDDNFGFTQLIAITDASEQDFYLGSRTSGTVTHHISSNGGVEFEVPFYNEDLFVFSAIANYGYGLPEASDYYNSYDDNPMSVSNNILIPNNVANSPVAGTVDFATAEDFTFLRFQGAALWNASSLA